VLRVEGTLALVAATTPVLRSEPFPELGDDVLFPRLSDSKLARLAERGQRRSFAVGDEVSAVHGLGSVERVSCSAVFAMIGADPCTEATTRMLAA
jgi:hypothetical protein